MAAISSSSLSTKASFFNQVRTQINSTCQKLINFIKNNFLNLIYFTFIVGSYFTFGPEISMFGVAVFATHKIVSVISRIFTQNEIKKIKKDSEIRKIETFVCEKKDTVFLPNGKCLHDSMKWLNEYNSKRWAEKKQMRKRIGNQTLETLKRSGVQGLFQLSEKETDEMQKNTEIIGKNIRTKEDEKKYFDFALSQNILPAKEESQKVEVIEGDSFDVALTLKNEKKYKNVSVLNMANQTSPGGGFLQGCAAQEETLCRRSNLFDSINIYTYGRQRRNVNSYLREKMLETDTGSYNIPEFGALYSPKVKVFRANQDKGYAYFAKPEEVNVISSAAYDIAHGSGKPSDYREKTKIKLQMILDTALESNQECIVLGAYGCGAFGNDPKEVASIVKEILIERPILQKKMKIVFAIIKDANDKNGNLEKFSELHNF